MNLNYDKTAFIPIDLQVGIVGMGEFSPYTTDQVLAVNQTICDKFIANQGFIGLVNVDPSLFPMLGPNQDQTRGSKQQFPQEFTNLLLQTGDYQKAIAITKYTPGAFFNTRLNSELRGRGIDTIVLSGIVTGTGVYATALEAYQHGYKVIIIEDGCTDRATETHNFVIANMLPKMATVIESSEL